MAHPSPTAMLPHRDHRGLLAAVKRYTSLGPHPNLQWVPLSTTTVPMLDKDRAPIASKLHPHPYPHPHPIALTHHFRGTHLPTPLPKSNGSSLLSSHTCAFFPTTNHVLRMRIFSVTRTLIVPDGTDPNRP